MSLKWILPLATLLLHSASLSAAIQCRACDHVATPGDCETWTNCGAGEICFTREFKETDGKQAYHLGCEAKSLCTLYLDAQGVVTTDVENQCFNCCDSDDCNDKLCLESVVKPTPVPRPKVCPEFYKMLGTNCYFFGLWATSWQEARNYCKKRPGSDLVSINSGTEYNYVNGQLIKLAAPMSAYWLGGFYSTASGDWEWVDRTSLVYAYWESKFPPSKLTHTTDYYIVQPMPVNGRGSKWQTDTRDKKHPFVCELKL